MKTGEGEEEPFRRKASFSPSQNPTPSISQDFCKRLGGGGMLEFSRMGVGLLDEIVSLGALAEKSISGKCGKVF